MSDGPGSSGRFRDWRRANADTAPRPPADPEPDPYQQPAPYQQRPQYQPAPNQQPAPCQQPAPYQQRPQARPSRDGRSATGAHPLVQPYGSTAPPPLEGVTDYRYDAPDTSYPLPGADPEPWRPPPEGRLRDPDEIPGPWPTRVSGPSAIAAVVLVVVVAVAGAIGLPRLLGGGPDEEVFERTSLTLPAEVAGLPRLPDAKITAEDRRSAEQLLAAVSTLLTRQTAVYARANGLRLTVVTGRPATALTDQELEILRTGFTSGMQAAQAPVTPLDAGPLGGWFGCGQTQHDTTLCLAMDAGGLVSIVINAKKQSAIAVAQSARRAVEHRTP